MYIYFLVKSFPCLINKLLIQIYDTNILNYQHKNDRLIMDYMTTIIQSYKNLNVWLAEDFFEVVFLIIISNIYGNYRILFVFDFDYHEIPNNSLQINLFVLSLCKLRYIFFPTILKENSGNLWILTIQDGLHHF